MAIAKPISHRGFHAPASLDGIPVLVRSVGEETRTRDYRWHGRERGNDASGLLQLTLAGCGKLTYEGRIYPVPVGHAMLLQWPHDHCYELDAEHFWQHRYVIVSGTAALTMIRAIQRQLGPIINFSTLPKVSEDLAAFTAWSLNNATAPDPLDASQRMYGILCRLLAAAQEQAKALPHADVIGRAQHYAQSRLHLPLQVADLAQIASMSTAHFSRLFHRTTGDSPAAWLNARRLEQAQALLSDPALDLETIALRCGFANANYFGKVFRRTYGIAPGAFRREC